MLISPAYAQAAGAAGEPALITSLMPLLLIFVVFYFLLIRPQQKKAKQHREMVSAVRRGDTVITAGGLVGKVVKVVSDDEVEIEIAKDVKVRAIKATLSDVRGKPEPAPAEVKKD